MGIVKVDDKQEMENVFLPLNVNIQAVFSLKINAKFNIKETIIIINQMV